MRLIELGDRAVTVFIMRQPAPDVVIERLCSYDDAQMNERCPDILATLASRISL